MAYMKSNPKAFTLVHGRYNCRDVFMTLTDFSGYGPCSVIAVALQEGQVYRPYKLNGITVGGSVELCKWDIAHLAKSCRNTR